MAWAVICVFLSQSSVHAEPLNVTIVLSEETGAYKEFSDSLSSHLENKNVVLKVANLSQATNDSDLIIAVGMKAASALAPLKSATIINVFIPKEGYNKLQRDFPRRTNSFTAIYLDQPLERQLDLITAALPNIHDVGILYVNPPNDLRTLRLKAKERNLALHEQAVTPATNLSDALQELLRNSEVILALPDAEIYNAATIRNILLATYRAQVPIIGFSSSFVRAGGLCAVFSTPAQVATQTASWINLYTATRVLPAAQYAHEFEVLVNLQVTRSLELNIPSSAELQRKIGGAP